MTPDNYAKQVLDISLAGGTYFDNLSLEDFINIDIEPQVFSLN